jgi:SET domain-containing protein
MKKTKPADRPYRIARSSAGLGLFATAPIKKGKFIVEYSGRRLDNKKIDYLSTRYLFELNNRWTIDGSTRKNTGRYINHGCRPNAEPIIAKWKIRIRAVKNIKPGDEITYNYGRDYFDMFIKAKGCRCKTCIEKRRATRRASALMRAKRQARANGKAGQRRRTKTPTNKIT